MALCRARVASPTLLRSVLHTPTRAVSLSSDGGVQLSAVLEVVDVAEFNISSQIGSCMPLAMMRIGTHVHNIELQPGQGGKLVRAAGTSAKILTEPNMATR
ncbi:60S ribosomal protein l2 mitochondrial [Phtheirospermum japonicum]|uniref:60S ribosomal protein l2 mitochondrial n=1 Tax=Phtheirospermum japonicum TaxID=374723 RepID=A0A830C6L5_9LAMI|nr:60S ribosomal protein l2 mitochondrial [Phtheirospermum japonicum]